MSTTQDTATEDSHRVIAELRRERDAAVAREAVLAEVLGIINRSPGDPGRLFEAILKRAHRLCGADAGALRRYDGEHCQPSIPTLLQTFAGQAVLAIENAELFQEAHRARTATEISLTDLRRTRDRLAQSEKIASLGQLTAGIAHDIKNPLGFVNNVFDLSVDLLNELNEAVAPDRLTVADGRRADGIVKNMLLRSRSGPSEHRAIDLNIMIEEALNLAYRGARAETPAFNITMEKDLDPNTGAIDAFPQELLRVMLNLINNGFYAARNRANQTTDKTCEPTPRLTTRDLGEQVEIRVRDNGAGISDGARDTMFEPFFITMPAGEGIGLGLSLSYDIVVKQHGDD